MKPVERVPFVRQMRLPEIGEVGQVRLSSARVALGGSGGARSIEQLYLERAGVSIDDRGASATVDVASLGLRHPAARDVGEGSLRALAAMRAILGIT